jgi:hypothetical protein
MKTAIPFAVLAGLLFSSAQTGFAVGITFRVNLEAQVATGNFNPSAHTIEVRGSFNGWGAGVTLSVTPTNANIYEGTADIGGSEGTRVQYKFVINQAGTLVWEVASGGVQNLSFNLPEARDVPRYAHFNNRQSAGAVAVTF